MCYRILGNIKKQKNKNIKHVLETLKGRCGNQLGSSSGTDCLDLERQAEEPNVHSTCIGRLWRRGSIIKALCIA